MDTYDFYIAYLTIGFSLFFLVTLGFIVLNVSFGWLSDKGLSIKLGASYFIGLAVVIFVLRLFTVMLTELQLAVYLMFIVLLTAMLFFRPLVTKFYRELFRSRLIFILFLMLIVIGPLLLLYWLPLTTSPEDINALIGSLHSGRYVALSNYFLSCDYIAVIGQNTGQSLLISAMSGLTINAPFLYLFALLLFSVVFFSIFIYGLILSFVKHKALSLLGTCVFMMGNASLSIAHVMSIDSGSPFGLNGYTDTLLGSFIIIMLVMAYSHRKLDIRGAVLVLILLSVSFLSAPQNIVLLVGAMLFFTLYFLVKERLFKLKAWWGLLILATALSLPVGGMLTPSSLKENIALPGVQSVGNSGKGLVLNPWLPFYITINSGWAEGNDQTRWFGGDGLFTHFKGNDHHYSEIIYFYEQTVLMGLRNLFFPILGCFLLYILWRNQRVVESNSDVVNLHTVSILGALFIAAGFIISYPFSLNGYKLELSRFLIPAITLGMLGLSIAIGLIYQTYSNWIKNGVILAALIAIVGPVSTLFVRDYEHIKNYDSLPFSQLYSPGLKIRDYMCGESSRKAQIIKQERQNILSSGLVPSAELVNGTSLDLGLTENINSNDKLKAVGILMGTSGLMNSGTGKLMLTESAGQEVEVEFNLMDLDDNRYNFFNIKPGFYNQASLTSELARGTIVWQKAGKACIVYRYESGESYTPGCPKPVY